MISSSIPLVSLNYRLPWNRTLWPPQEFVSHSGTYWNLVDWLTVGFPYVHLPGRESHATLSHTLRLDYMSLPVFVQSFLLILIHASPTAHLLGSLTAGQVHNELPFLATHWPSCCTGTFSPWDLPSSTSTCRFPQYLHQLKSRQKNRNHSRCFSRGTLIQEISQRIEEIA